MDTHTHVHILWTCTCVQSLLQLERSGDKCVAQASCALWNSLESVLLNPTKLGRQAAKYNFLRRNRFLKTSFSKHSAMLPSVFMADVLFSAGYAEPDLCEPKECWRKIEDIIPFNIGKRCYDKAPRESLTHYPPPTKVGRWGRKQVAITFITFQ